jgi:hypothetical protein
MASDSHGLWKPNPPPRRRRDDKPTEVQATRKPSVFAKVKAGLGLAKAIRKAQSESSMKNWKTTLGGLLLAIGQAAPAILPSNWTWLGSTLTGIGGILIGGAAADSSAIRETAKK